MKNEKENGVVTVHLTERQRYLVSEGLLRLMQDCNKAITYVGGEIPVVDAINEYRRELQRLNSVICTA